MRSNTFLCILFLGSLFACKEHQRPADERLNSTSDLHRSIKELMDVHVFDITSPPLASRSMVYPILSAQLAYASLQPESEAIVHKLNGWDTLKSRPPARRGVHAEWAALAAFLQTGAQHVYSIDKWQVWVDSLSQKYQRQLDPAAYDQAWAWGRACADAMNAYAKADGLPEIRTRPKYSIGLASKGKWVPTPPNYMDPIEPHWGDLRPFTLDSGSQYVPIRPTAFDMAEGSAFHAEAKEVYTIVNKLTEEEREIAAFWDCNPYVVLHKGHFMQPVKKITPGGHWMGITRIACLKEKLSFAASLKTYSYVSVALADAFIACWDEKYRSNYIRPETVINMFWDDKWMPTLQTPPFPEYTSGHSVISTAAARALTHLHGENFSFVDTVEVEYGLPKRTFDSFLDAAQEAAISRVYGGIHFRPAVDEGVKQGHEVADRVLQILSDDE
jgi:hypothetical protein